MSEAKTEGIWDNQTQWVVWICSWCDTKFTVSFFSLIEPDGGWSSAWGEQTLSRGQNPPQKSCFGANGGAGVRLVRVQRSALATFRSAVNSQTELRSGASAFICSSQGGLGLFEPFKNQICHPECNKAITAHSREKSSIYSSLAKPGWISRIRPPTQNFLLFTPFSKQRN